jgi:hypothetical protein
MTVLRTVTRTIVDTLDMAEPQLSSRDTAVLAINIAFPSPGTIGIMDHLGETIVTTMTEIGDIRLIASLQMTTIALHVGQGKLAAIVDTVTVTDRDPDRVNEGVDGTDITAQTTRRHDGIVVRAIRRIAMAGKTEESATETGKLSTTSLVHQGIHLENSLRNKARRTHLLQAMRCPRNRILLLKRGSRLNNRKSKRLHAHKLRRPSSCPRLLQKALQRQPNPQYQMKKIWRWTLTKLRRFCLLQLACRRCKLDSSRSSVHLVWMIISWKRSSERGHSE